MKLKLKNNPQLEITTTGTAGSETSVTDNFKSKATSIFITGCPKVNAKKIVDDTLAYQSTRLRNLKNIRIQLPYDTSSSSYKFSGTFDSLMSYTSLSGIHDDGTTREQPAFIGTWTITDYVDDTMKTAKNGAFVSGEPNVSYPYELPAWNDIAAHTLSGTRTNYNPAVSIILQGQGKGNTKDNTQHFPGKWWLTTAEASAVSSIENWFTDKQTVSDTNKIVDKNTVNNYNLTNFNQFSYFTGVTSLDDKAFYNCTSLQTLPLDNRINSIGASAFYNCNSMSLATIPAYLTKINDHTFTNCSLITLSEIPSGVTSIGTQAFSGCTNLSQLHLLNQGFTTLGASAFDNTSNNLKIYFGDNGSAILDHNKMQLHLADANWARYSSKIDNWYKHENTVPADYTQIDYVRSDGRYCLDTGLTYKPSTRVVTDICFTYIPNNNSTVHGTAINGLSADTENGLIATVGTTATVITEGNNWLNSTVHNYDINLKTHTITVDKGTPIVETGTPTVGSDTIKFFGSNNNINTFVGKEWMTRIYEDNANNEQVLVRNYIPCYRNSDKKVGFYDSVNNTFLCGNGYYTTDGFEVIATDESNKTFLTEDGLEILL